MGNEDNYILTDEKGNPIFMVVAQGSYSSELWMHFMKIDISSLSNPEEAKKYIDGRPIDLVDKQELAKILLKIDENKLFNF